MKYLYENHEDFAPLPSYFVIPGLVAMMSGDQIIKALNNDSVNLAAILHGEQYLEILSDLPTEDTLESQCTVKEVLDKGSGAAIVCNGELNISKYISEVNTCVIQCSFLTTTFKIIFFFSFAFAGIFFFLVDTKNTRGESLAFNQIVAFAVGAGNFGGQRTGKHIVPCISKPTRKPDAVATQKISLDQAALYRY